MRPFIVLLVLLVFSFSESVSAKPLTDKTNWHNLSSKSSNAVHASTDDRICVFCHTPHGGSSQSPLWNRKDPATASFPLYSSGTLNIDDDPAIVGDSQYDNSNPATYPNGATRMCLSCHDGVSAIGEVLNDSANATSNIAMTFDTLNAASSTAVIDLATSHPVSFVFNATVKNEINAAEFGTNYQLPTVVPLDSQQRMQCTTCHDPHNDTKSGSYDLPFWRNYSGNDVTDYDGTCQDCHLGSDWGGSWGTTPLPIH